jgi:hypothetical protein
MDPSFLAAISKLTPLLLTGKELEIYPGLFGSLQYAAVCTRPDISTAFSIMESAHANPTEAHMHALKKMWLYLKGTPNIHEPSGEGGVQTTHSNLQALLMQTRATTTRHGARGRGFYLHWAEAL